MILAGVSLNAMVGDNGIITRAKKAGEEMERAQVKEELELKLIELQTEKIEKRRRNDRRRYKECF